jgi:hypothetical protein
MTYHSQIPQYTINQNDIISMVLIYAVFSGLWILISDTMLEWFISDPSQIILVGMIKGWLYVAASSSPLLYSLTHRLIDRESILKQTEELAQRNTELERFNRAAIGRELDMIALKQQINELSLQFGLQPPYDLSFLESSLTKSATGDKA